MPRDIVEFDWKDPDYYPVYQARATRLDRLRKDKGMLEAVRQFYRDSPIEFIEDWGFTFDPRLVGIEGRTARMPFLLFPKQREFLQWMLDRWKEKQDGTAEKSRDMGLSWLTMSLACTLCIFNPGMTVGFGSRKEEYVDKTNFPKSLFFKGRMFMDNLPIEFRAGWRRKNDAHMRIVFPDTEATITGEAGDNIGRGDRSSIYVTDEDAYIPNDQSVDASLSQTTNCRIRISSANGTDNSFYQKRQQWVGTDRLFTFHWREDPRKDDEWYADECAELDNPVIIAQELDINYTASVEGILIPNEWVQAAVDAHKKLGFGYDGLRRVSLDVADRGKDKNAACGIHGVIVQHVSQWTGQGSDIFATVQRAFGLCDDMGAELLRYDADGLGAGVAGDARILNKERLEAGVRSIRIEPFISATIFNPDGKVGGKSTERTNKDYFANGKAQSGWGLRSRFLKTYRMVKGIQTYPFDELISLSSEEIGKSLPLVITELSQPTYASNSAGKITIDKTPDDKPSPNMYDSIMMVFAQIKRGAMTISDDVLAMTARR